MQYARLASVGSAGITMHFRALISVVCLVFCCQGVYGEMVRFEKAKVRTSVKNLSSCQNVWWRGLMAIVAEFSTSQPTSGECRVHVEAYSARYHYLNVTLATRDMTDTRPDGSCDDYVQLFADYDRTRPLTRRLCGRRGAASVMTSRARFLVVVFSNGGGKAAGFTLRYESLARLEELADSAAYDSAPGTVYSSMCPILGFLTSLLFASR